MKYWLKDKLRRIKRVADFLPIVWRGRDFDYNYSIDLFHYQLERTADYLESNKSYSLNAKQDARRIRTAIDLGKRVFNEDYSCEYFRIIEAEYGPNALIFHFEDTGKGDGSSYLKYNYEYWDNADEISERLDTERAKSWKKQEKAERIYWDFLKHNIRHWWD